MLGCRLQCLCLACTEQTDGAHLRRGRAGKRRTRFFELPPRLARHRFAVVYQLHVWPHQPAQVFGCDRVVRAAQHQRINIPFLNAKIACAADNTGACCYGFRSVSGVCAALNGICQTVAWHHREMCQTLLRRHQGLKLGAGQCAARGHHGDMPGFAQGHRRALMRVLPQ